MRPWWRRGLPCLTEQGVLLEHRLRQLQNISDSLASGRLNAVTPEPDRALIAIQALEWLRVFG